MSNITKKTALILLSLFSICFCMKIIYRYFDWTEGKYDLSVFENWQIDYCITAHDGYGKPYKYWYGGYADLTLGTSYHGEDAIQKWRNSDYGGRIDSIEINIGNQLDVSKGDTAFQDSISSIEIAGRAVGDLWIKECKGLNIPDSIKFLSVKFNCSFKHKENAKLINVSKVLKLHKKSKLHFWLPIGY